MVTLKSFNQMVTFCRSNVRNINTCFMEYTAESNIRLQQIPPPGIPVPQILLMVWRPILSSETNRFLFIHQVLNLCLPQILSQPTMSELSKWHFLTVVFRLQVTTSSSRTCTRTQPIQLKSRIIR